MTIAKPTVWLLFVAALFTFFSVVVIVDAEAATQSADMYHALGLQCRCDAYDCQCKKDCLCKIVEQGAPASFLETETTVSASADPKAPSASEPATSPSSLFEARSTVGKQRVEPALFKCGCDFGGADIAMSKTQGLDCDCSIAKCECTKKCACTDGAGGQVSFVETEQRTMRMTD